MAKVKKVNIAVTYFAPNGFKTLHPIAGVVPAAAGALPVAARSRKTNRALGISAEPQSLKSLQDLTTKTFPEYEKDTR